MQEVIKLKTGVIYCIENKVNGKKYIGQTVNQNSRLRNHRNRLDRNKHRNQHLQDSWNKYGEDNFQFKIIEDNILRNNLNEREIYYISKFDSFDNGYNQTIGGHATKGYKHDEETIKIIGEASKGRVLSKETREKLSEAHTGKTMSKESRIKMSKSHTGKKLSKEHRNKIGKGNKGIKNHEAKINKKQGLKIYYLYQENQFNQYELADIFNVTQGTTSNIVNCKHWTTRHLKGGE